MQWGQKSLEITLQILIIYIPLEARYTGSSPLRQLHCLLLLQKSSPNELSKKDLQMRSTNKDLIEICWKLAWRLLGVWWEYDLWNPWTTSKEVISIGSPNGPSKKFSKWALQIETWLESAGSPLGVRWESAGNPVGVCWESAGSLLGVCWESNGNPLGVR